MVQGSANLLNVLDELYCVYKVLQRQWIAKCCCQRGVINAVVSSI